MGVMSIPDVFAEDVIPSWVKNNAGWWATDQIDDASFLQGIQFLIKEEIMVITYVETSDDSGSQEVPGWVKNNAGWWANNQINDSSFVLGIKWLISNGIIVVEEKTTYDYQEIRVAFVGDQGGSKFLSNDIEVLKLIKNENVEIIIHQGDLGFEPASPTEWDERISEYLGEDFPYLVSEGHHDQETWKSYQEKLYDRIKKNPNIKCEGDIGVKSNCTYNGLLFILIAPGKYTNDSDHDSFVQKQLQDNDSYWKICSMHNELYAMQTEAKLNKSGMEVFEACKDGGAIIATGHQHLYSRTGNIIEFIDPKNQKIDLEWYDSNKLRVKEGSTFAFVSGLGGSPIASQVYDEWPINYAAGQNATYGALFCSFNAGGQPNKAYCYFKDIDGAIVDSFTITSFLGKQHDDIDFVDADLSGRDLTDEDLSNKIITDSDLTNTILVGADLSNSVLIGTKLTGTDLTYANLTNVNLAYKDLTGTILRGANLSGGSLAGIDLSGVDITNTILRGTDLSNANLDGIDLSGKDLTGTILKNVDLTDKDLTGTILREANLSNANLDGIDLSGKDLTGTILKNVDLTDKDLTGTILREANLSNANLSGQDLSSHDLTNVILTGSDLTNSSLPDNGLSGKNFHETIFDGVDLSGKDLSESHFQYASFKNTNLKNVNLTNAIFIDVDLTKLKSLVGANLSNTVFTYSNLSGNNIDGISLYANNLQYSNLSGLDFSSVSNKSVIGVVFMETDLSNANFEGVSFASNIHTIILEGRAYLDDMNLVELSNHLRKEGAHTVWVTKKEVIGKDLEIKFIRFVDFTNANLQNVNFSNADLTIALLKGADLTNANLSNAILQGVNLSNANLQNVNFSNADLSKALLRGADLTNANLNGAVLDGAILSCKNHPICKVN